MSIFPKKQIEVGDIVIGVYKYGWSKLGGVPLQRFFITPSIVLEIKESQALVFFEQTGPEWYDITKLERCYVKEEYKDTGLAKD